MRKIVVLIVENDAATQTAYRMTLEDEGIDVIAALTLDDAIVQLATQNQIDAVVLDGCLHSRGDIEKPDTLELAATLREVFAGPTIAASNSEHLNRALRAAGCKFSVEKTKVPAMILELFGIA